ncbi:MAG: hypothetical protein ABWW70_04545 [Thermoproteota archaeon]
MAEEKKGKTEKEIEKDVPEWMREALEVRHILKAVSDFISDIKAPLKDILDTMLAPLSGERLGRDVGSFYKNLRESGVPEEVAIEMTKKYLENRLRAFDIAGKLEQLVSKLPRLPKLRRLEAEIGEEEEKES